MEGARLRDGHRAVCRDRNALALELLGLPAADPIDFLARRVIDRSRQAFDAVKVLLDADDGPCRALEFDAAVKRLGRHVTYLIFIGRGVDLVIGRDMPVHVHIGVLGDKVLYVSGAGLFPHHDLLVGDRVGLDLDDVGLAFLALFIDHAPVARRLHKAVVINIVLVPCTHAIGRDGVFVSNRKPSGLIGLQRHENLGDGLNGLRRAQLRIDRHRLKRQIGTRNVHGIGRGHVIEHVARARGAAVARGHLAIGQDRIPIDGAHHVVVGAIRPARHVSGGGIVPVVATMGD